MKDSSPSVRYSAVIALGRIATVVPKAVDDLILLLSDKELRSAAGDALAMAGPVAIPAMTKALNHPDWTVRNHLVHSLAGITPMTAATPALMAALKHPDAEMRHWAVRVVGDLISRAGSEAGEPFVDVLAKRQTDESSDTRRGAALALLNMGACAVPAKTTLKKAAAEDSSSSVRDFAKRALEAIREGKSYSKNGAR